MRKMDGYAAVARMQAEAEAAFGKNHKITRMFSKCIANTLETTIKELADGSVFVITGDIPAMWLRDSSCQLRPFLLFASEEPEIRDLIVRLIRKQMQCILIDPYANAFNEEANGNGYQTDQTEMKPELWERKYEIDSLGFPFQLSYLLWKNTGAVQQFDEIWLQAAHKTLEVLRREQFHESRSTYLFERRDCVYTDTLSRGGKGALVREGIGLTWSGFRPSDDACIYGYLIPSNMLASVALSNIAEIAENVLEEKALAEEAASLGKQIRDAIACCAIPPGTTEPYYAYEVDGFGQYNVMDDANLPSLLSMPYIGFCDAHDVLYKSTRKVILSEQNPYFFRSERLKGIGSPHTPPGHVWPISLCIQGITSTKREEKEEILRMLADTDADTCLMHESINVNNPDEYTRPWFSWANSVFCEFVMDYLGHSVKR